MGPSWLLISESDLNALSWTLLGRRQEPPSPLLPTLIPFSSVLICLFASFVVKYSLSSIRVLIYKRRLSASYAGPAEAVDTSQI